MSHDPERLEALADRWWFMYEADARAQQTAEALREYARLLRVLGRDAELRLFRADEGWVAQSWGYYGRGEAPQEGVIADTPLAALLALADALATQERDA